MPIPEIEASLPHGFHDAVLVRIDVDYAASTATLTLQLWIGLLDQQPGQPGRGPVMRRAALEFGGLAYCAIEPPQTSVSPAGGLNVDGANGPRVTTGNAPALPDGCSFFSLYAGDWNSSIDIAAREARFQWLESEASAWSNAQGA
jgi:hypothetical protein